MTSTPAPVRQALCCECGNLRTYRQLRNARGYWGDPNWNRALGNLKCSPCGRVTTHATVSRIDQPALPEDVYEQIARGADPTSGGFRWSETERRRIQQQYRQGNLPRNPNLKHMWWSKLERAARDRGDATMIALCGEEIATPPPSRSTAVSAEQIAPDPIRDQEYTDLDTGLSWRDVDCVDCLRVWNNAERECRRKRLQRLLMQFATNPDAIPDSYLDALLELLGSVDRSHDTGRTA